MFPFGKIKPFLVTNEDSKLASLFGRKNRGLFGRKMQKISEISRKKCKGNAKNCLILCHHDSFPKNYKLVIRPLKYLFFSVARKRIIRNFRQIPEVTDFSGILSFYAFICQVQ